MKQLEKFIFTTVGIFGCIFSYYYNPFLNISPLNELLSTMSTILVILVYPKLFDWRYKYFFTHWYNINKATHGEESWENVKKIILEEPLDTPKKRHTLGMLLEYFYLSPLLILIPTLNISVGFVIEKIDIQSKSIGLEGSTITVIVAIITAIISFYYNSRLTARVKSRIDWVNELRNTISDFLGTLDQVPVEKMPYENFVRTKITRSEEKTTNEENDTKCSSKTTETVELQSSFKIMSKLELMLNPSEEMHRTLMALLRLSFGIANIKIDEMVYDRLGYYKIYKPILKHFDDKEIATAKWPGSKKRYPVGFYSNGIGSPLAYGTLLSHIFRIATAITKAEWERAKDIQ